MNKRLLNIPFRRLVIALVVIGLLTVGLALDLANRGLAWRVFWSLTGEETPLAQVRGMVEWAGNYLRPALQTAPDVPISHTDVSPYGINTFLQQEVEIAKRDRSLQMISEAGFKMIRQQFEWADIEVGGRGDFTDRRNDLNGDGTIDDSDAISAWAKYDNIVDLAEKYGIQIQARLDNPPKWSRANPDAGDKAPPDDYQDFVNFAVAVAERYQGRIHYYQIWNEPNANEEWGKQPVNPEAYTDLLCRTYTALKAVDPNIVVISGPLSPTVSLTESNLNDFIFLQRMYDAGAKDCFDVMSAQGYGFFSGPTDRRMRPMTLTYSRHIYIRDIMVANGDANKSIWISEAAWNPQPDDPNIIQNGAFGIVTEEEAARYMPLAYQRAQEEWPWLGNISYWFFKRPADYEKNQAFYYFRMVEPDFTPLPIYDSMKRYITGQTPTLYAGVHQAESWAVTKSDDARIVEDEDAEFGQALETKELKFAAYGTDIVVRIKDNSYIGFDSYEYPNRSIIKSDVDDTYIYGCMLIVDEFCPLTQNFPSTESGWVEITVLHSFLPTSFSIQQASINVSEPFQIDSVTVLDRTVQNILPLAAGALIALGMTLYVIVSALRERRKS